MVMDMELSFGEKIRLLREESELTQEQLGTKLNMTQRKVSYMERDKYQPSLEDLRAICQYFGVSADYFLGFSKAYPFPKRNRK